MPRIAFYTFGILCEPWGHPAIKDFEDRGASIWESAEGTPGYIGYLDAYDADPRFVTAETPAAITFSLWADLESVYAFAYAHQGRHAEALRHRRAWFLKGDWPTYVAWWIANDHTPTFQEAVERFEHLHDHGPSPFAFNFRTPFDADGRPVQLDRHLIGEKAENVQ